MCCQFRNTAMLKNSMVVYISYKEGFLKYVIHTGLKYWMTCRSFFYKRLLDCPFGLVFSYFLKSTTLCSQKKLGHNVLNKLEF